MALRLRRPAADEIAELLRRCRADQLTYSPTGGSLDGTTPKGLRRHRWSTDLAPGSFDSAVRAIVGWEVHRRAGLLVAVDGGIEVGTNVALVAPLPVGFVDATCRIVAVVEESDRFGFAYGTLGVHPESGEESFVVNRSGDVVRFEVVGISRPAHPVARALPPLGDRLQDRAVRRYLAAMRRSTNDEP
jgi:uncharacterized protein (UPF0548 family)